MAEAVSLLALPCIDPARGRIAREVRPGSTVAEMVALALPGLADGNLASVRVTIGPHVIEPGVWHLVRPRPATHVVIRVMPGKGNLRSILTVVVAVAAIASGQFYGAALAASSFGTSLGLSSAVASALITTGVTVAGNLLINSLVPVRAGLSTRKDSPTYSIDGWQNVLNLNGPVPDVLGKHRFAPPYAAKPYTETIGDDTYVRTVFVLGYGPLKFTDFRLGDTPLSDFKGVEQEFREGLPADTPLTLYRDQVFEERFSVRLTQNSAGNEPPTVRVTASDVSAISVDILFPAGLIEFDDEGKEGSRSASFRHRYRLVGDVSWTTLPSIYVSARRRTAFTRNIRWNVPVRGRYEVELLRLDDEAVTDSAKVEQSVWSALRSIRPEYPIALDKPLALIALRIKASEQLNGIVDTFNCVTSRVCLDWNGTAWVSRETRNPASLFRYVLQSPAMTYPLADAEIDLLGLQDWHAFCAANGLTYDRVHDFEASVWDVLADVAAAGRATPHDQGDKWGVVVDRTQTKVVAHISPRNSWDFEGGRSYVDLPDAFLVKFLDAEADYEPSERIVRRPGFVGAIDVMEALELPGVTDATQAWKEGYRRFLELEHRPDRYTVNQDFESLIAARGDLAQLSHDVLDRTMVAARVKSVDVPGRVVELDEWVEMEAGVSYAARFRHQEGTSGATENDNDEPAVSILRTVETVPGRTNALILSGNASVPIPGDLAFFGPASVESFPVIVQSVERGENLTARLTLMDHAPQIETLLAAAVVPAFDGRFGTILPPDLTAPLAPEIFDIRSGNEVRNGPVEVYLRPGAGSVALADYVVQHRLSGAGTWNTLATIPASTAVAFISGYTLDQIIEIRARATSLAGTAGVYGATSTHQVGINNARSLRDTLTLLGLTTGLQLCLDPADILSYGGSGKTWIDRSTSLTNFYRGVTANPEASDPTFAGEAGGLSASEYWAFGGEQLFTPTTNVTPTWAEAFHKDNAAFTIMALVRFGAIGANQGIFGNRANTSTSVGFELLMSTAGLLTLLVSNGSALSLNVAPSTAFIPAAVANTWYLVGVSVNEATGTGGVLWHRSGLTDTDASTYTTPSVAAATRAPQIAARGNSVGPLSSGSRLGGIIVWNRALSAAEMQSVYTAAKARNAAL